MESEYSSRTHDQTNAFVSSGSDGRDNHVTEAADIDTRGLVCRLHKLSPCK